MVSLQNPNHDVPMSRTSRLDQRKHVGHIGDDDLDMVLCRLWQFISSRRSLYFVHL